MFIREVDGQFIFADEKKSLKYQKIVEKEIKKKDEHGKEYTEIVQKLKNVVVFSPQPKHFFEAGYKELIRVEEPEIDFSQYIETTYELKDDDKYYEVHNIINMSEVIVNE